MRANTQSVNQYTVDKDFYTFINDVFLTGPVKNDEFWHHLTITLSQISQQHGSALTAGKAAGTVSDSVSLSRPRYALKALNARWGSLYSALYHEQAIPHSAGLKTGSKYNVARGSRVVSYAKEFLDSAFPLTEGSHKDAVSYLVYFQNMMVILADGSTVGLQNPAGFVAKSGPRSNPDSIVLKHRDLHVEIVFNSCGATGSQDIANIEDIRIEAPANTLISCHAQNMVEKNETYQNLRSLVAGSLKARFNRSGVKHTRFLHQSENYTAKDGDDYEIKACNPMVLQLDESNTHEVIWNKQQNAVPAAVIDAIVASLAMLHRQKNSPLELSMAVTDSGLARQIRVIQEQLAAIPGMPATIIDIVNCSSGSQPEATAFAPSADTLPTQFPYVGVAEEDLLNTVTMATQNGAVLKAIHHFG